MYTIRELKIKWMQQINYMSFNDYVISNYIKVYNIHLDLIGYEAN